MHRNAKNGYLLHYLHSAAPAALCVNTLTDNSGFHKLHYITQMLRCALGAVWTGCLVNAPYALCVDGALDQV